MKCKISTYKDTIIFAIFFLTVELIDVDDESM